MSAVASISYSPYFSDIAATPEAGSGFVMPSFATREEWLSAFVHYLRPVFKAAGSALPEKIRISCAFPIRTTTAIGQILSSRLSADGTREIFISPVLSDAVRVCDVVIRATRQSLAKSGVPFCGCEDGKHRFVLAP